MYTFLKQAKLLLFVLGLTILLLITKYTLAIFFHSSFLGTNKYIDLILIFSSSLIISLKYELSPKFSWLAGLTFFLIRAFVFNGKSTLEAVSHLTILEILYYFITKSFPFIILSFLGNLVGFIILKKKGQKTFKKITYS